MAFGSVAVYISCLDAAEFYTFFFLVGCLISYGYNTQELHWGKRDYEIPEIYVFQTRIKLSVKNFKERETDLIGQ